jgi:hypothetical protein
MKKNYKYDAFISYRQLQPDIKVANKLHKALERYKIPKGLVKKGFPKKLSKVFKDVDELSATSDLADSIKEALIESKYLIVICSPRTKESKWVKKEIDTFIELGGSKRILTLIIEGDIEETIPVELMDIDKIPLASDIRDENELISFKKLKNAKLRLIAPIIGCDYDDLVQRQAKEDIKFLWIFSAFSLFLASVFVVLAISLKHTNQSLEKKNTDLNQAIFETSAIYAQFFLTVQDDYTKWEKATSKIIEIIKSKKVERAIKLNQTLAKYITVKGYNIGKNIEVVPFFESPQYFLKTLFFRKSKYTMGYIEDRYITLFLLDSVEFPAKLFLFLANPPIKLPAIYQRMHDAIYEDLLRYGYFLQAIDNESKGKHQEALKDLQNAVKMGFYHSLTGVLSPIYLDAIDKSLYIFDDKKLAKRSKYDHSKARFMHKKEKFNLVKYLNIYFILSISYARTHPKDIKLIYQKDKEIAIVSDPIDTQNGKITYKNIVDYIERKIQADDSELGKFIYKLKHPKFTPKEEKYIYKHVQSLKKLRDNTRQKLHNILQKDNDSNISDIKAEKILEKYSTGDFSNDYTSIYFQNKDIRDIDKEIENLSNKSIKKLQDIFTIPTSITSSKEIRIYISQQIRPYSFDISMYNRFISDKNVLELLKKLHTIEPNNIHIKFALRRYWQIQGDFQKANNYRFNELDNGYFQEIEQTFRNKI